MIKAFIVTGFLGLFCFHLWAERGKLLQPSTWQGLKEEGVIGFLMNFFSNYHRYIYMRFTREYIWLGKKVFPLYQGQRGIAENYHGKVLTPELVRKVITIDKSIPLQDLEQIIPYQTARNIILEAPLDIVVMDCPCRASAKEGCQPSQVCMVIGKPFTDFTLEHHPKISRRLTTQEALELLEQVHRKGCVHTAWFKNVCLERFYVICNCCKCCCGGIEAMVKYHIPMMASSGYIARINDDECVKCMKCVSGCPFEAISSDVNVNWEKCMGCGVCITYCKKNAISLERDPKKGKPLDMDLLIT